ncbi:MAG TPA: hypothetical protein DDW65_03780 [Firmicutes bacterium]|jgi:ABC-type uncharacterized transport system substrate-binding protein|nr:hypothetical protein [Bacillota bacterium]
MRFLKNGIWSCLMILLISATITVALADDQQCPVLNHGHKWRIGFCESEPYLDYASSLYYVIQGMKESGWISGIEDLPFRVGQDDTLEMWKWLSTHHVGDYIQFVGDAHYDLKEINDPKGAHIIRRLKQEKDLDLMIVTGTSAGLALSKGDHTVPTLIFSTSDPIGAGLIKSANDSGKDNIWVHVDQGQFRRQIQVFHDGFHFKRLGLVYEHSDLVRNYIALGDIETMARERNFSIVDRNVKEPVNQEDQPRYYRQLKAAYQEIAPRVDAMLLTVSPVNPEKLPQLLTPFSQFKVPVFSQSGAGEVRYGALMSITQNDFPNLKMFAAGTLTQVLHGRKPRSLPQVFESTPRIILNVEVAKLIGYQPTFDILLVADEIYRRIGN